LAEQIDLTAVTGIDLGATDAPACETEHVHDEVSAPAPEQTSLQLSDHTTLRVGGPARRLITATDEQQILAAVREADDQGERLLVLGGGSNLLVADEGFAGTVVKIASRGVDADVSDCAGASVTVAAGEVWDDFVAYAIGQEWIGVETLSGIPGLVGSTPIQNVGAYGADVAGTIAQVRTYDRHEQAIRTFAAADCGFAYRDSRFKREPGRYVVLSVTFQFELGSLSAPIAYSELARTLGVELGQRAPLTAVREAVLALRRGKAMVLDEDDHDTWSAGSFFTNPVLSAEAAEALPEGAPRFAQPDGTVKTSAAWLIEHAGFTKGHGTPPATLSTKHTLALTNRGGARAADIVALAREVRDGVATRFGITLVPEPIFVGVSL